MRGQRPRFSAMMVILVLLSGCQSGEGPRLYEVTGTVTFHGKPLSGAMVSFLPLPGEAAPRGSNARTDSSGTYRLAYNERYGALPGKYSVEISSESEILENRVVVGKTPETIPAEYNDKTTLEAEVKASGENRFDFELTGEREKKKKNRL